jgi:hypothetical protein
LITCREKEAVIVCCRSRHFKFFNVNSYTEKVYYSDIENKKAGPYQQSLVE